MNIRDLRKSAGLTQVQLAEKVGVAQATVAEWERGDYYPRASIIPALAAALGCAVNDLYATEKSDTA